MNLNKKGITLLVLVITLAICAILITVVITQVNNNINSSRVVKVISSFSSIEQSVKEYYFANNFQLPTVSSDDMKNVVVQKEDLYNEIKANKDDKDYIAFYKVDFSKLNLTNIETESETDGDVFLVSYPTLNVYKLTGYKLENNKRYYSLSSKLEGLNTESSKEQVEEENTQNVTSIEPTSDIYVRSLNQNIVTNEISLVIQTTVSANEVVNIAIPGKTTPVVKVLANPGVGSQNIVISKIDDLKQFGFTNEDLDSFRDLSASSKYIDFVKVGKDIDIVTKCVKFEKLDTLSPQILDDTEADFSIVQTNVGEEQQNVLYMKAQDVDISGIKEIRYEYLKKYSDNPNAEVTNPYFIYPVENYYSNMDKFDVSYLKEKGKVVNVSESNKFQIHLPENIAQIQILVIDNAGNVNAQPYVMNIIKQEDGSFKLATPTESQTQ